MPMPVPMMPTIMLMAMAMDAALAAQQTTKRVEAFSVKICATKIAQEKRYYLMMLPTMTMVTAVTWRLGGMRR